MSGYIAAEGSGQPSAESLQILVSKGDGGLLVDWEAKKGPEQDPSEGAPIPSFCKYVEEPQAGKISIVNTVFELRILIDMLIAPEHLAHLLSP